MSTSVPPRMKGVMMGQAVDLPDPSEVPPAAATSADAKQDESTKTATPAPAALVAEAAPAPAPAAPTAPAASAIADPSAAAKQLNEALASGSAESLPKVQVPDAGTSSAEKNALSE